MLTQGQAVLLMMGVMCLSMALVAVACMVVAVRVCRPPTRRHAEPSQNGIDYTAGRRSDSDTPTPRLK